MSDTNMKNTGGVQKSEARSPKSEQKAKKPKRKTVIREMEENNSEIETSQSAIADDPAIDTSQPPQENKSEIVNPKRRSSLEHNLKTNKSERSEIKNMEVHHHPDLHHEKKPWKEYLLEGLMIFLAVTMGFIAESIRENITNKEHAWQLTSQLVQDLKSDTSELNVAVSFQQHIVEANDSLFVLLQRPMGKTDLKKIQKLIIASHNLYPFHPTGGASAAIKNELHLKQFTESDIIHYIAQYEGRIQLAHTVQDIYLQYQRTMLDPFLRQHFTPANLDAAFAHKPLPDAQMRNLTQADLTQLSADMVLIRVVSNELVTNYKTLKQRATTLLQYVQKQYHVE